MSSDLVDCTIADIAAPIKNALVGGPFGSNLVSKDYVDKGVPVIRGKNMGHGRLVAGDFVFVSSQKANDLYANIARPGDLIFTQRGTLGQVAIIPDGPYKKYIVSQSQMKLTVDPKKANTQFLYYLFCSPEQLNYIQTNAIQVGVPHTNLGILRRTPITLPAIEGQREIAKILGSLDDKIENNRQTNQTLEQIAQTIFKSWFVDFDPVKAKIEAKAAGCDPERAAMCAISGAVHGCTNVAGARMAGATKSEAEFDQLSAEQRKQLSATAALFPDELVESELGLIPAGWGEQRLENLLELSYGKALKKTDRENGIIPVYGSGGVTGYHNKHLVDGPGIVVGRKGTVGSLYWEDDNFFPIDTVFYVVPKCGVSLVFLFYLLQTLGLKDMNTDAAVPGLNRNNAYRLLVPSFPTDLIKVFTDRVIGLRWMQSHRTLENSNLAAVRDALLPKLLSGELRPPSIPPVKQGGSECNEQGGALGVLDQ